MKRILEDALKIRHMTQSLQHIECVRTYREISSGIDKIEEKIRRAILECTDQDLVRESKDSASL